MQPCVFGRGRTDLYRFFLAGRFGGGESLFRRFYTRSMDQVIGVFASS